MNSSSPQVRRRKPGSRPAHILSPRKPAIVAPAQPQRIASAGQVESYGRPKVPRTSSHEISSGLLSPGNAEHQRIARVPDLNVADTQNTTVLDASDRKNEEEDTMLFKSMNILPEPYQKKLESLAISKIILTSEINGIPESTFELSEHDADFGMYDLLGEGILKVDRSIVFSPYSPSSRSSGSTLDCFNAVIRIQNTSKFNMTYLVESSSLKMFEIGESLGYICPESTKEIMITTNPDCHLKYKDIARSSFSVSGYPILFRSQLSREKLDALWNALTCQVLSGENVERHAINWVYPKYDSMMEGCSILERVQFQTPLFGNGNPPKIDSLTLPAISAMEFHTLWSGDKTNDEVSLMKFKLCQLEKSSSQFKQRFESEQGLSRQTTVIGGLFMSTMLGYMVYRDFYGAKEDKLESSWYEGTFNTCGYFYESFTNMISYPFKSLYAMIFT